MNQLQYDPNILTLDLGDDRMVPQQKQVQAEALWHGIPIEGFNTAGEEMIRAMISRVPPELLKNVHCVKAAPELQPKHGRYDPDIHTVNINPLIFNLRQRFGEGQGWIYHAELTVAHEIGHSIYYFLPEKEKDKWRELSGWMVGTAKGQAPAYKETRPGWPKTTSKWTHKEGIKFTRKYAQKNDDEDFADSFAFYLLDKPHQMEPSKRDFIHKIIDERVKKYPQTLIEGPTKPYGEKELMAGGPGSGCNPEVADPRCGRPSKGLITVGEMNRVSNRRARQLLERLADGQWHSLETKPSPRTGYYTGMRNIIRPLGFNVETRGGQVRLVRTTPSQPTQTTQSKRSSIAQQSTALTQWAGDMSEGMRSIARTLSDGMPHTMSDLINSGRAHGISYPLTEDFVTERLRLIREQGDSGRQWTLVGNDANGGYRLAPYGRTEHQEDLQRQSEDVVRQLGPQHPGLQPGRATTGTLNDRPTPQLVSPTAEEPNPDYRKSKGFLSKDDKPSPQQLNQDNISIREDLIQPFENYFKMSPKDYKDTIMNGVPEEIIKKTTLEVTKGTSYWSVDLKAPGVFSMERYFYPQDDKVSHSYFTVDPNYEGKDFGKQLFSNSLDIYDHLGIDEVKVHADINVGGYAWARYGFVPDSSSWESLRNYVIPEKLEGRAKNLPADVKAQIKLITGIEDPKAIWLLAALRDSNGKSVGKELLLGTDWTGKINLDDKENYAVTRAYASPKKKLQFAALEPEPVMIKDGKKTDDWFHEDMLSSEEGQKASDLLACLFAVKNGWTVKDALRWFKGSDIQAYGTSEGVTKAWDTRGRGRHPKLTSPKFDQPSKEPGYVGPTEEFYHGTITDNLAKILKQGLVQDEKQKFKLWDLDRWGPLTTKTNGFVYITKDKSLAEWYGELKQKYAEAKPGDVVEMRYMDEPQGTAPSLRFKKTSPTPALPGSKAAIVTLEIPMSEEKMLQHDPASPGQEAWMVKGKIPPKYLSEINVFDGKQWKPWWTKAQGRIGAERTVPVHLVFYGPTAHIVMALERKS